ncbi:hypothetical protein, partial [Salmonella enterica]|uniref:hypothetical protein n=1 Tax=Salmonella enterica TaxID=28901 RepID=UPI001ABF1186
MPVRSLIYVTVATVIGANMVQAQQREAVLQQVEVAGAGFSIVIATAKPGGATADYRGQPDPNLVYLPPATSSTRTPAAGKTWQRTSFSRRRPVAL